MGRLNAILDHSLYFLLIFFLKQAEWFSLSRWISYVIWKYGCLISQTMCIKPFYFHILLLTKILSIILVQVNEYPSGVGLSPHIDTHSAFEGSIYSLSLSGPCIMEFRRYSNMNACFGDRDAESCDNSSNCIRKAIYLPPRSMLLLSGEGRYAWQHYIPHHKVHFACFHFLVFL